MKKTKKLVKKTRRLLKKADFLTLADDIRANRLKAKSEEDEKIESLAKSLAHAIARPGRGAGRRPATSRTSSPEPSWPGPTTEARSSGRRR
jgi:hypothetical protein